VKSLRQKWRRVNHRGIVAGMSWAAFWIVLDGDMGEEDWTFMVGIWGI
jgi:hypothetical protein